MTKAYSYLRMSRPEQLRGDSLRRQLQGTRDWATKHGLELDESLRDLGVSAFRGDNKRKGALAEFLRMLDQGEITPGSVLIVESLDRLSRETVLEAQELFAGIIRRGVEIVTLHDGQRYSAEIIKQDWTKLIISLSVMARAHEESAAKSKRLSEAWEAKRADTLAGGKKLTGRTPAWLRLPRDRSAFVEIPERVLVVREIFAMSVSGMGTDAIANALNRRGEPPWGRSKGWQPSYIAKILSTEAVLGRFRPHLKREGKRVPVGETIEGYFPRVVDDETFLLAADGRRKRSTSGAGRKGRLYNNLLSGIVRCAVCGGPMHHIDKGKPPKGGRYFQCDRARRAAGCDHRRLHRYGLIETTVLGALTDDELARIAGTRAAERDRATDTLTATEGSLNAKEVLLRKLMTAMEGDAADDPDDPLIQRIREVRKEIRHLKKEAERLRREAETAGAVAVAVSSTRVADIRRVGEAARALRESPAEEVYEARSKLAAELKRVVSEILFSPEGRLEIRTHSGSAFIVTPVSVRASGALPSPDPAFDEDAELLGA